MLKLNMNTVVPENFASLAQGNLENIGVLRKPPEVVDHRTEFKYFLFGGLPVGMVINNNELANIVVYTHGQGQEGDLIWLHHTEEDGLTRVIVFPSDADLFQIQTLVDQARLR